MHTARYAINVESFFYSTWYSYPCGRCGRVHSRHPTSRLSSGCLRGSAPSCRRFCLCLWPCGHTWRRTAVFLPFTVRVPLNHRVTWFRPFRQILEFIPTATSSGAIAPGATLRNSVLQFQPISIRALWAIWPIIIMVHAAPFFDSDCPYDLLDPRSPLGSCIIQSSDIHPTTQRRVGECLFYIWYCVSTKFMYKFYA
jgi:hypothetical protein